MNNDLEFLLLQISTSNWNVKISSAEIIVKEHGHTAVTSLIELLKSSSQDTRDAAAIALRDIKDRRAVEPLFECIKKKENENNRATLVYALETLDCSDHFLDIVDLALSDKADVSLAAMNILIDQGFMINDEDLDMAYELVNKALKQNTNQERIVAIKQRLLDFKNI
jgi:HEAT repeat protein